MRKSRQEQLKDLQRGNAKPTLEVDGIEGMLHLLVSGGKPDKPPNPTQRELVFSNDEMLAYVGMAGAAKTSAICALGWLLVLFEPGYRLMVGRRDYNDLKDTTLKRMEEMLARLPPGTLIDRNKEAPMKWWIQPVTYKGELPPNLNEEGLHQATLDGLISEITFMGLNDRPRSYEFHGGIVDEADEVDKEVFDEVQLRCRLPDRTNKMAVAFNPTDEDHWIYAACTGLNEKGEKILRPDGSWQAPIFTLFKPQKGENSHNLRSDYYDIVRGRLSPDMAERMIDGQWGSSIKGTPVYGRVFKREFHAKSLLSYNPYAPLVRFHDFGYRHSACIWGQPTPFGGIDILWELHGENVEIHEWAPRVLAETRTRFADNVKVTDWGDPAAKQHKDTGSTLAVLNANGITLHFIPGARIDAGIRTLRHLLSRQSGGVPAFRIDKRCTIVTRMLEKGYRYPDESERKGRRADEPLKDGYFDHFADALRYGIHGLFGHQLATQQGPEGDGGAPPSESTSSTWMGSPQLQRSVAYAPSLDPQKMRR